MNEKKLRTDAWESRLTDEQQWSLYAWSRTPLDDGSETPRRPTYDQARAYIAGEFGKDLVPARTAWFRFLASMRKADHLQELCRIEAARDWGREVVGAARMEPEKLAAAFRAKAMDAMMDDDKDAVSAYSAAAAAILNSDQRERELDLKARAQSTKEDQLRLAREKFEAAEKRLNAAKETANDTKLTNEQKLAKMKEIFG